MVWLLFSLPLAAALLRATVRCRFILVAEDFFVAGVDDIQYGLCSPLGQRRELGKEANSWSDSEGWSAEGESQVVSNGRLRGRRVGVDGTLMGAGEAGDKGVRGERGLEDEEGRMAGRTSRTRRLSARLVDSYVLADGFEKLRTGDVVTLTLEQQPIGRSAPAARTSALADGKLVYRVLQVHEVVAAVDRPVRSTLDRRSLLTIRMVYTDGESVCDESCVNASMWAADDSVVAITWESSYGVTTFPIEMGAILSVNMGAPVPTSCDLGNQTYIANTLAMAAGYDIEAYTHVEYYLPSSSQCGFGGLGYVGCAPPYNHLVTCYTWVKATHTSVRTHEFGHNYGLSHAAMAALEYGDASSVMGAPYRLMGYNAPNRIQLGWLPDAYVRKYESSISPPASPPSPSLCPYLGICVNYDDCYSLGYCDCAKYCWYDANCCLNVPPPPPAPPLVLTTSRIELRSLYLDPKETAIGEASAVIAACAGCVSGTAGYGDGGSLIVSYRTPHGYDAQMNSAFHYTVSVHLQRNFDRGTEVYAHLSANETYYDPTGYVVHVCETHAYYAVVAMSTSNAAVDCGAPLPKPLPPPAPPIGPPPSGPPPSSPLPPSRPLPPAPSPSSPSPSLPPPVRPPPLPPPPLSPPPSPAPSSPQLPASPPPALPPTLPSTPPPRSPPAPPPSPAPSRPPAPTYSPAMPPSPYAFAPLKPLFCRLLPIVAATLGSALLATLIADVLGLQGAAS